MVQKPHNYHITFLHQSTSKEYLYGLETKKTHILFSRYEGRGTKEYLYGLETDELAYVCGGKIKSKEYLYGLETSQGKFALMEFYLV